MKTCDKEILHIALPSIVSNITVPLLGMIDVAITGHMGQAAYVAAIAVGGMLFNIIYWLFVFLRMGTSGMTAQAYGANDRTETKAILRRGVTVAVALAAAVLCLQTPIRNLALTLIAPSPEVMALARTYFNICVWGAPAALLLFVLNGWFLGMQNSKVPMAVAIVQNVSNIIFSLILVYGQGWKIEGVALGTVLAQYVGLAYALYSLRDYSLREGIRYWGWGIRYWVLGNKDGVLGSGPKDLGKRTGGWSQFFLLNRDILLRTICLIFVHFYFIAAGARFGDTALAVNALVMQLFLLYSYIMDGFAFAGEALVGKAVGARSLPMLRETVKRLFVWGGGMMVLFTLCYALFGQQIMNMLTNEPAVLQAAADYQGWALLLPVCGMAAFIWDGIFIGATRAKGMLLSVAAGMLTFFGLFELLCPTLGNHALWLAFNVYVFVRGAVQTVLFIFACG